METLTLKKSIISFDNRTFNDEYDLSSFIVKKLGYYKLEKLKSSEISDDLKEEAELCRKKDSSYFLNI